MWYIVTEPCKLTFVFSLFIHGYKLFKESHVRGTDNNYLESVLVFKLSACCISQPEVRHPPCFAVKCTSLRMVKLPDCLTM